MYITRNAGLEESQAGIKIAGRNINNLRYARDTTVMAETEKLKHAGACLTSGLGAQSAGPFLGNQGRHACSGRCVTEVERGLLLLLSRFSRV